MIEGQKFPYPGADAKPEQVLQLAEQYRVAAEALRPLGRPGKPLSRAPYRFVAIHAIELHLNAFLLAKGHTHATIRGMQHDLAARTKAAVAAGLVLRKRTAQHIRSLSETREYLITRYDPALSAASEINRLAATLDEVSSKSTTTVNRMSV